MVKQKTWSTMSNGQRIFVMLLGVVVFGSVLNYGQSSREHSQSSSGESGWGFSLETRAVTACKIEFKNRAKYGSSINLTGQTVIDKGEYFGIMVVGYLENQYGVDIPMRMTCTVEKEPVTVSASQYLNGH